MIYTCLARRPTLEIIAAVRQPRLSRLRSVPRSRRDILVPPVRPDVRWPNWPRTAYCTPTRVEQWIRCASPRGAAHFGRSSWGNRPGLLRATSPRSNGALRVPSAAISVIDIAVAEHASALGYFAQSRLHKANTRRCMALSGMAPPGREIPVEQLREERAAAHRLATATCSRETAVRLRLEEW